MFLCTLSFYSNPYLPGKLTAIEGPIQPVIGPDGKKKELESNVLLASTEKQYVITIDVLHKVRSCLVRCIFLHHRVSFVVSSTHIVFFIIGIFCLSYCVENAIFQCLGVPFSVRTNCVEIWIATF